MTVTPSEVSTNQSPEELGQEADLDLTLDAELDLAIPEEVPTADDPSSRASRSDTDGVGFTLDEFASLLSKYDYNFKPGDVVNGTVFALESKGAMIDIGAKTAAFMPLQEVSINRVEGLSDVLQPGEIREFFIMSEENEDGQLSLSIRRIEYQRAWERVRQLQKEDATIYSEVFATNRGGALVRVEGLRGFIPGIRPGKNTANYLDYVLTRITVLGAAYITVVCVVPEWIMAETGMGAVFFGGTSLLIVVNVTVDTITQIQSHLLAHQYGDLIKKAKLKGRLR